MNQEPMTAPVGSIQKFSVEDGPGIRTTVFLKGCPLRCKWCHNPEMIDFSPQLIYLTNRCIGCGFCIESCPQGAIRPKDGKIVVDWAVCDDCLRCTKACYAGALKSVADEMTVAEVVGEAEKDKGFYEHTGGGITVSGGEMLSRPRYVAEIIREADSKGIHVCLDTSGFGDGEALYDLAASPAVTDILYDMKCIQPQKHLEGTGVDNQGILENLVRLAADARICKKITMRMPLISGYNDTDEIIKETAAFFIKNNLRKVTLLPYHTLGVSKSERIGEVAEVFEPPSPERLVQIRSLFELTGITVEVLGQ
ncbi:MAG: glycyl-radical enzyme activating protein [Eubacteriales bacterium]|jgi:pyruvate formate lyase activating enzyme|nr:glycyl-radical enzyme activating protein [Eubacteriales bacterium]MDD4444698.1 glycyl-radical enzyme activating protein [Eubacteriales bacterium]